MSYEHDLKPCPWCGGEADAPDGPYGRPVWVYEARCTACHALGAQADTKADVVNAWNRRPAEDSLRARAEAAEQRAEAAEAALKQAQDDGRLMLASMGIDMWRRLDAAGRTRLEQELDSGLRNSTEDDGERVPYAELYAYRRLLALGDFFDNPRGESPPVAALPEPEWYTEREADDVDRPRAEMSGSAT